MSKQKVTIIAAMDNKRGIGIENRLPWRIPEDLEHFKYTTFGEVVIMGRKTLESMGRPLPNRIDIVLTRGPDLPPHPDMSCAPSLEEAIKGVRRSYPNKQIFVIGGAEVYKQALTLADRMVLTHVDGVVECDTFFPEFNSDHWRAVAERQISRVPVARVIEYERKINIGNEPL